MMRIVLGEKIYGKNRQDKLERLGWEIASSLEDLKIDSLDVRIIEGGWVEVEIDGEDEVAAANLVKLRYGQVKDVGAVSPGDEVRGFLVEPGKYGYGIYVDFFPGSKDVLIPLFSLRRDLTGGRRLPLRKILWLWGMVEHMPLMVRITRMGRGTVEGELGRETLEMYDRWMARNLDVLVITGATLRDVRRALRKSDHARDVVGIERLAFLAHAVFCKGNTRGVGLVPRVGPRLPGAAIGVYSPSRIRELLGGLRSSPPEG